MLSVSRSPSEEEGGLTDSRLKTLLAPQRVPPLTKHRRRRGARRGDVGGGSGPRRRSLREVEVREEREVVRGEALLLTAASREARLSARVPPCEGGVARRSEGRKRPRRTVSSEGSCSTRAGAKWDEQST